MQAQRDGPPHEPHARRLRHGEVSGVGCREPLSLPVLVLNRVYQPVRITSARRAILLLYTDVARALDEQGELFDFGRWRSLPVRLGVDDALPIVRGQLRVPRVVHLRRYARLNRPAIRLNRRNLMLRDDYQCQYCGARLPPHQLDIDHIQPRSRGGA